MTAAAAPGETAASGEFQEHGLQRRLGSAALAFVAACALLFSAYQLTVAAFAPLSSLIMRSIHVGFLLLLIFLLYPLVKRGRQMTRIPAFDWVLAFAGFGLGLYQWFFEVGADPARRRPDDGRPRRRHRDGRAGVRGGAPRARRGAADRLRDLPALRPVRPVPARRARAPAVRVLADRRPAGVRHRGHLRHPDAGLCDPTSSSSSCSAPSSSTPG